MTFSIDICHSWVYIACMYEIQELESLRKKYGYTQYQVSKFIGATERTYQRWIMGESHPSPVFQTRIRLCLSKLKGPIT